jgi:hypothetical protein
VTNLEAVEQLVLLLHKDQLIDRCNALRQATWVLSRHGSPSRELLHRPVQ